MGGWVAVQEAHRLVPIEGSSDTVVLVPPIVALLGRWSPHQLGCTPVKPVDVHQPPPREAHSSVAVTSHTESDKPEMGWGDAWVGFWVVCWVVHGGTR